MDATRKCLAEHGPVTLRGSMLYTSGEPCRLREQREARLVDFLFGAVIVRGGAVVACAMCMGAILWRHVERLVFAASVTQLATKIDQIMLSSAEVAAKAPFAPISITGGVLTIEAMALFK
jgi:tRNA(Arg) A34 adenosine deaminase TadA